ncbi:MAG TPA: glycosyltransferase family 4 protein [Thermoanaerobaculia bacterium]|nr:glycosyltransferase family 4 protein [Thermoanaerobaculia bacterium]
MRVLLLCTDSYGGHGGIALYNRDLAEALASRPDCEEVTVIPRVVRTEPEAVPAKVRFMARAARGPLSYLRALFEARRRRPDLVICGHINLLPVAFLVSKDPLLLLYGIEAWKRPGSAISGRLLHRCRGIVAISRITRDRFLAWSGYAGRMFLLPNAIHPERYGIRPPRQELVARYGLKGKRVILTVGRLAHEERYKGFDEVLEVLPALPEDVVYVIAGGGSDQPRLEAKAAALGVRERVVFTGYFPEEEKADLYSLADVFVMPSRGEGFGFVFLEALASGLPVIGSRIDGGRDALLDGELGLLVDPANSAEIEAAIRELLARRERHVPPRLEHFSFEHFTARLAAIVDDVMR